MARYDKYEPFSGGFRAPLAADTPKTTPGNPQGVSLDVNGRVLVSGAPSHSGYKGIICLTQDKKAADIVDTMTDGEVVEFAGAAGTNYFIDAATGDLVAGTGADTMTPPAAAGSVYVGFTVEATRLVVRVAR
jgi:hypothetical protein